MKKVFLLLGVSIVSFTSCQKNNQEKKYDIAANTVKLSMASEIFMKNNATEVAKGNPSNAASNYEFEMGDYNNDGEVDLYAIKKFNTETNATEIHVLSGANNYKSSLLKTQTVLKDKKAEYEFELGDYNNDGKVDLFAIKKNDEESNFAEIHVLNGAKNYKSSLLKTQTVLNKTGANYEFELGDYNNDGKVDLYAFITLNQKNNFAEICVFSGASNYRKSLIRKEIVLDKEDDNYEYQLEDLYFEDDVRAIKKQNRGTRLTAI